jgi:uncharacterized membrane protein YfcA
MDYVVVCVAAMLASALTLFSGFGLGTLLLPAFAIFFPIPVAVAATAMVHLANNVFKLALVGRRAHAGTVLRFAVPAAAAAFVGAWLLGQLGELPSILAWRSWWGGAHEITWIGVVIAGVMIGFAVLELSPRFDSLSFAPGWIPVGGVISGFFGGLSGHQGALRTAFLSRAGLTKEAFIATGVVSAVVVDVARLGVYGREFYTARFGVIEPRVWWLVGSASVAAFVGAYVGSRLARKVTMRGVRVAVGVMLLVIGVLVGLGVV